MKSYSTVVRKDKKVKKVKCDWCGEGSLEDGFFAGGSGSVSFGYGSKKHDGDVYSLDICDSCFDRLIKPYAKLEDNYLFGKKGREWLECQDSKEANKAYRQLLKELKCRPSEVARKLREKVWKGKSPKEILEESESAKKE